MSLNNIICIVPAYNPPAAFVEVVKGLLTQDFKKVIVVNDGSSSEHEGYFATLHDAGAQIIRHVYNQGKGAALKTAFASVVQEYPDALAVVTVDADGQHLLHDVINVCQHFQEQPTGLMLGCRKFAAGTTPLRSLIGNKLTQLLLRCIGGLKVSDTQTGLRVIRTDLLPELIQISAQRYEYELDMLLFIKHAKIPFSEFPITTQYEKGNPTSHFSPVLDSMRIYYVLFRFFGASLLTAIIDNLMFGAAFTLGFSVIQSQIVGRTTASIFNFFAVKKYVFFSRRKNIEAFTRYFSMVIFFGICTYFGIMALNKTFHIPVIVAKITVEGLIFFINFILQREWVFKGQNPSVE